MVASISALCRVISKYRVIPSERTIIKAESSVKERYSFFSSSFRDAV